MVTTFRLSLVPFAMLLLAGSGCRTHTYRFTSDPPGAAVSLYAGRQVVAKGITPMEKSTSIFYNKARFTFPGGYEKDLALHPDVPREEQKSSFFGNALVLLGATLLGVGLVEESLPLVVGGAGVAGFGSARLEPGRRFDQLDYHVTAPPRIAKPPGNGR